MSNFAFLAAEFPAVHEAAVEAERQAAVSPTAAAFFAGKTVEVAVKWAFKSDPNLKVPYQDNISALLHEPSFRRAAGEAVFAKARYINTLRNRAVHEEKRISAGDAAGAVKELFHVCFWFARTYARKAKPADNLAFDPSLLSRRDDVLKKAFVQLKAQQSELEAKDGELTKLLLDKQNLDEELKKLRAEVAAARKAAEAKPDLHDYNEAETRDRFIDLLLREAGWPLDRPEDTEFRVEGMPNNEGTGFVDYVLWGADGKPVGLVEAKRTRKDARVGQQQAKLYADLLEARYGQRPVIFYSNGYEHWIWDDTRHPPRPIQGFLKKDELALMIQRRSTRKALAPEDIDRLIVERPYQHRAIRRVTEAFERDRQRKALLVMATGAGKTRTIIALADLLMRANWVKRVLFLADRKALVKQAVNAFKAHLPDAATVNLLEDKTQEGRVYVSTYPTMMGLIDEAGDDGRRFGVGHFDLVVIDEAHRSVYRKYKAIFEYFDSLLVGLTATPKGEVDRDTYRLFDLQTGVPTDAYGLDEAVSDGWLVPPKAVSLTTDFLDRGIRYDQLTDDEKEAWDALEWSEDGAVPGAVEPPAINKWLFNADTVDRVLKHLMEHGLKVQDGDRLGKTVIFAKNRAHAEFIGSRFDANYPHLAGHFARVVVSEYSYAQSLVDDLYDPNKPPHIAISVDMLDTGVDVPQIVNLVFFKPVRSKTKFWQMIGRGTRLCPDLFGPARDKEFFTIFDWCRNFEFFNENPEVTEGAGADSLAKRLFTARVTLVSELDSGHGEAPSPEAYVQSPPSILHAGEAGSAVDQAAALTELRTHMVKGLRTEVEGMSLDNFLVRPHRRYVEKFANEASWTRLDADSRQELIEHVAGLPSQVTDDDFAAKQFDLLVYRTELALLRADSSFVGLRGKITETASLLEELPNVPMVAAEMALILEIQTDEFWQDITLPMLETARRRLRALVKLIEHKSRPMVYSDFEDRDGNAAEIAVRGIPVGTDMDTFRRKARQFLKPYENHLAVIKVKRNEPLTAADLADLEHIFAEAGADNASVEAIRANGGVPRFVRSLVGLDREAAKRAFSEFFQDRKLSADQFEFLDMIIDHLTARGVMDPKLLYETPFTDFDSKGVDGVFDHADVVRLVSILRDFEPRSAA